MGRRGLEPPRDYLPPGPQPGACEHRPYLNRRNRAKDGRARATDATHERRSSFSIRFQVARPRGVGTSDDPRGNDQRPTVKGDAVGGRVPGFGRGPWSRPWQPDGARYGSGRRRTRSCAGAKISTRRRPQTIGCAANAGGATEQTLTETVTARPSRSTRHGARRPA